MPMINKNILKLALVLSGGFSVQSYAASTICQSQSNNTGNPITITGQTVAISPSTAVSTTTPFKQISMPISVTGSSANPLVKCRNTSPRSVTNQDRYDTPQNPSASTGSIIPSNIAGVGYKVYYTDSFGTQNFPQTQNVTMAANSTANYYYGSGAAIHIDLYKTSATTGSGSFTSGLYATEALLPADDPTPLYFLQTSVATNGISIISSTCAFGNMNQTIAFPKVGTPSFKAVGTTQSTQKFNLVLNCNTGANASSTAVSTGVKVQFDYTTATDASNNAISGVVANTATSPANGVAVRLLDNSSNVVAAGSQIAAGTISNAAGSAASAPTYTIPLQAQYYQTKSPVSAGKVTGLVNLTIVYQ